MLYFNKKIGVDSIKRLHYIHSFSTNVYSMTVVIKDAFLMMMRPRFCLPMGFLCVNVLFADKDEDAITYVWKQSCQSNTKMQVPSGLFWSAPDSDAFFRA